MLINDANQNEIEALLLGGGRRFQPEQITVINSNHSTNIMACPGSGKTTVLIAKLALLLAELKKEGSRKGICVITHTNVAVEEIVNGLEKLGVSNITYPNFIGTIHEFFNTFFSLKAYGSYTKKDDFYLLDTDEYKKHFERTFMYHKPEYWSYPTPTYAVERTDIHIDDQHRFHIISRKTGGGNYSAPILNTVKDMFFKGYVRHSDTVGLANWYIRSQKQAIQKAFQNRFQYFFIDEAQDTSTEQYENLKMLIENNDQTIVQWYGDSYQALYSLYGRDDAWKPAIEESLQINYSNRFGESIAKVLRTTCIEKYNRLEANDAIKSTHPHLFIYNNDNKKKLIRVYLQSVTDFKVDAFGSDTIKGKIKAVSHLHESLGAYSETYQRAKVSKPLHSEMQACLQECHQSLLEELRRNDKRRRNVRGEYLKNITQFLNSKHPLQYTNIKTIWASWIRAIIEKNDESLIMTELENKYKELISAIVNNGVVDELETLKINELRPRLVRILQKNPKFESSEKPSDITPVELEVELNTIHGVKGETHFATLLLETVRDGGSDLQKIFGFLTGAYQTELLEESFVKDTLKLAYVALSRPRYFAGVAIHEDYFSEKNIQDAVMHGWKIVKVEDRLATLQV